VSFRVSFTRQPLAWRDKFPAHLDADAFFLEESSTLDS